MTTIKQALTDAADTFVHSDSPEIDSHVLLCHVLQCQLSYLHTWPEKALTSQQLSNFKKLTDLRKKGVPIAHLIQQRGFWTLDLKVTKDTLIPRPDSEVLVMQALAKMTKGMLVADLGTGTGAIALSLASDSPESIFFACDYSAEALKIAQYNAKSNQINNVLFWQGNWLAAIKASSLDMIVSNPPYIEQDDPHLKQGDVAFEPIQALASGIDGLDDIRKIIAQAQTTLKPMGWLLIEHGYTQAESVKLLFQQAGFAQVECYQDFGENDRVTAGQLAV